MVKVCQNLVAQWKQEADYEPAPKC
jgi:hypothetical protein